MKPTPRIPPGRLAAVVVTSIAMVSPSAGTASSRPSAQHQPCGSRGLPVTVNSRPECLPQQLLSGAWRSASSVDTGRPGARDALAMSLVSLLASRAPHGADRQLTMVEVTRVARALTGAPGFAPSHGRAGSATTTSHTTPIAPSPGEVGAGQTGVAQTTVAPGQSGEETLTQTAFANGCPDASGYLPAHAVYATQTSLSLAQPHRLRLLTTISATAQAHAIGHVTDAGKLRDFDVVIDVELSGSGRMVGPAGLIHGDTMSTNQKLRIVLTGLDPHSWQRAELSGAHIGSISLTGQGTGRYELGADGSLLVSQDVDRMVAFGTITLSKLREAFGAAERNFYGDAKCLQAQFSPATLNVPTGSSTPVQVTVTGTRTGAPAGIDLQLTSPRNGTVTPAMTHVAPSRPGTFTFDAGSKQGQDVIIVSGVSRQGRIIGHLDEATRSGFPYYYRVIGASYSTHADGQTTPGNDNVCESNGIHAGGGEDRNGSSGALPMSDANAVSQATPGGMLSGRIWADVPTTINLTVFGCTFDSHGTAAPCQQTLPTQSPQPNGTTTIGFSITAASAAAATATLHWAVPDPEVGVAGGGSDPCNAPDLTQSIPYTQLDQTVPMAQLSSTQPQTYTFSGGPQHWSTDALGQPLSLNYQWQYTLTLQRVNQDGSPIR